MRAQNRRRVGRRSVMLEEMRALAAIASFLVRLLDVLNIRL